MVCAIVALVMLFLTHVIIWDGQRLDELVVGRARPVDAEENRISALTERERAVIAVVGQGLKNEQIGERLAIAEITVRQHLTSILDKLGVASRLELVIFALRHGLIVHPHQ